MIAALWWRTVNHAAPVATQSALQARANNAEVMSKHASCQAVELASRTVQPQGTRAVLAMPTHLASPSTLSGISGLLALPRALQHRR